MPNLFSEIPKDIPEEIFEDIVSTSNVRIERIVSKGRAHQKRVGMTKTNMNGCWCSVGRALLVLKMALK